MPDGTHDSERFELVAAPGSTKGAVLERHRDRRHESDRIARREPGWADLEARGYFVATGAELVEVIDPAEGHTLTSLVQSVADRMEAGARGDDASVSWWAGRDFVVYQRSRLVATVRRARNGSPVITTYR